MLEHTRLSILFVFFSSFLLVNSTAHIMHPVGVDPRPPCSIVSSSTSANGSGQSGGADAEVNPVGGGENEDIHNVNNGMSVWEEALVANLEPGEDSERTGYPYWGDWQVANQDHCRPASRSTRPFQKWMRTLHKRALRRQGIVGCDGDAPAWLGGIDDGDSEAGRYAHRRYSSSDSSFAFVTGIKSASISMAGVSLLTRSRKTTIPSSRGPRTDRSSRASLSGPRHSEDSCCPERQVPVDPAVVQRAMQRRHILEELISTEESYIGDVRFLMNVCLALRRVFFFCFFFSLQTLTNTRSTLRFSLPCPLPRPACGPR